MADNDPFHGARIKLARAKHHLDRLGESVQAFLDSEAYSATLDKDSEPGAFLVRIKVTDEPPVDEWAPLIGDVLYNLRSALDHIVYELATPVAGNPPSGTEFPIFTDAAAYGRLDKKGNPARGSGLYKVRGVPVGAQALIESLQPFNVDPSDPDQTVLAFLHALSNFDKHRELHISVGVSHRSSVHVASANFLPDIQNFFGPAKHDAVAMRIAAPPGTVDPKVDMNIQVFFGISFEDADPGKGAPVTGVLIQCASLIEDEILPALLPYA